MIKWLAITLVIFLITCAECQEPEEKATRKYQDELFKSESTETTNTDINTTLRSTEIENNSTTTESSRPNDEVDARNDLDEDDDELSSARDANEDEVVGTTEWTTIPEHEYSLSIKDVFNKGIKVVKDKGIGIIQSWLEEQENELSTDTTRDDYDYTPSTDDYTDVNMTYDDDQTGIPEDWENNENDLKENEDAHETDTDNNKEINDKEESKEESETTEETSTTVIDTDKSDIETLDKIEDDLEKLQKVDAEEEHEVQVRDELLKDIEKNLKSLEAMTTPESTTVDADAIVEVDNDASTEEPHVDETENTPLIETTEVTEAITTSTVLPQNELTEEADNKPTTELSTSEEKETTPVNIDVMETTTVLVHNELVPESEPEMEPVETVEVTEAIEEETTELPIVFGEDFENEAESTGAIFIVDEIETSTQFPESHEDNVDDVTIRIIDERTDVTENTKTVDVTITEDVFSTKIETVVVSTTETADITSTTIAQITEASSATENEEESMLETTRTPSTTTEVQESTTTEKQNVSEEFVTSTETPEKHDSEESNEDEVITTEILPVETEKQPTTTTTEKIMKEEIVTTTEEMNESDEIVDEVVDEIIDEIKEMETTSSTTTTTTEDPTKVLLEETMNLTKTIDKALSEEDKALNVLTSNAINENQGKEYSDEFSEDKIDSAVDMDTSNNENDEGQDIEQDSGVMSIEKEVSDDMEDEMERKKILADGNRMDNTLADVNHHTTPKEEVAGEVADPKVSALITDRLTGNVCLNASGLAIKITTNNHTYWVPSTARVLGECTSFGAFLNFTWKMDKEIKVNHTLSFTFIGDEEESYVEEVILNTNKGNLVATQLERYFTEPTIINMSKDTTITLSHLNIKMNHKKEDYATISLLSVDNALALQIASGGLCLFIVLVAVSIYSYRKLRSQARIFKVSLDK